MVPFALLAMAIHRIPMLFTDGCSFWKLLGCGHNGTFDLQPDWQQWGLLAVWDEREDFDQFMKTSFISRWWRFLAYEQWTVLCQPIASHGLWDGKEPFGKPAPTDYDGPVAVLTRATIHFRKLKNFWWHVDEVADMMASSKGFVTSVGIGEAPVYRQATFSVWESQADIKTFAYGNTKHAEVVKKTRSENWYREELFARFVLIDSLGTLNGMNPVKHLIKQTNEAEV